MKRLFRVFVAGVLFVISAYIGLIVYLMLRDKRDYLESLYDDAMSDYELWRDSLDWDSATVTDWTA